MAAMLQRSPVVPRAKQQQQQQHTHLQKVSPDFVVNSYPNGKKRTNQVRKNNSREKMGVWCAP
jgi:hypothetical protein